MPSGPVWEVPMALLRAAGLALPHCPEEQRACLQCQATSKAALDANCALGCQAQGAHKASAGRPGPEGEHQGSCKLRQPQRPRFPYEEEAPTGEPHRQSPTLCQGSVRVARTGLWSQVPSELSQWGSSSPVSPETYVLPESQPNTHVLQPARHSASHWDLPSSGTGPRTIHVASLIRSFMHCSPQTRLLGESTLHGPLGVLLSASPLTHQAPILNARTCSRFTVTFTIAFAGWPRSQSAGAKRTGG